MMRKYSRASSIDPLVEDEMNSRPNQALQHPTFPEGVYHAQAPGNNGYHHQEAHGSHMSYLMNKRLGDDIREEMNMLSEQQELISVPRRFKGRTEKFSKFFGKSENNALKNLLYGNTPSGYGHSPEEPLGKDISNDYAASKDAQD